MTAKRKSAASKTRRSAVTKTARRAKRPRPSPKHARVAKNGSAAPPALASAEDTDRLLHALDVHRVELGVQNEELVRARAELETTLARYTELFDFAPLGYVVIDDAQQILQINLAGAALMGRERPYVVGKLITAFVHGADLREFHAMLQSLHALAHATCEVELERQDNRRSLRFTATKLPGAADRTLLAMEDVTERNLEAARLVETERALREADRKKDEFLAMLSHELRNPLAALTSSVFVLAHAAPGSEHTRTAQEIIERQVKHLRRLVDDLLDLTRITRGKIQLQRARVDLVELVRRTIADHQALFDTAGLHLVVRLEQEPIWAHVDPARIVQLISNVLSNAHKFTPLGGSVEVTLSRDLDRAVLAVRDTGLGIAREILPQLFEPFAQGPQPVDRQRGGLGLGLAMVKRLAELHGGVASIASAGLGHGTHVQVSLPLATEIPVAAETVPLLPVRSVRVLIVEDHDATARGMATALALAGHSVEIALDGAAALTVAQSFDPEVVFCDIGLPGDMDGYELARQLLAAPHPPLLVALSGYAQPDDVRRAKLAGFDRHIAKPADPDTLIQVIAEAPARPRSQ